MFSKIKLTIFAALLVVSAVVFSACKTDEGPINFDPKFSVNIAFPMKGWPVVKKLTPEKKEIFDKYGMPDAFHIYWDSTGGLQTRDFVKGELKRRKENGAKQLPDHAWIYLSKGVEVFFGAGGRAEEKKISDQVKIICRSGDPQEVKTNPIVQWTYYSIGKTYRFSNSGSIIEEKDFPATGGYFVRN